MKITTLGPLLSILLAAPALAQDTPPLSLEPRTVSVTVGLLDALQGNLDVTGEWALDETWSVGGSLGVGASWANALLDQDLYNALVAFQVRRYFETFEDGWFLGIEAMFKYQFGYSQPGWDGFPDSFEEAGFPRPELGPGYRATGQVHVGYKSIAFESGFTWDWHIGLNAGVQGFEDIYEGRAPVFGPTIGLDLGVGLGYSW